MGVISVEIQGHELEVIKKELEVDGCVLERVDYFDWNADDCCMCGGWDKPGSLLLTWRDDRHPPAVAGDLVCAHRVGCAQRRSDRMGELLESKRKWFRVRGQA